MTRQVNKIYSLHTPHVPSKHPARDANAKALESQGSCIHPDPEMRGIVQNVISILEHADPSLWTVVVQDDAVPYPGWKDILPQLLDLSPSPMLSLLSLGVSAKKAETEGYCFARGPNMLYGPAWAMAPGYQKGAAEALRWLNSVHNIKQDDWGLAIYFTALGKEPCVSIRSLFYHEDTSPSLCGTGASLLRLTPLRPISATDEPLNSRTIRMTNRTDARFYALVKFMKEQLALTIRREDLNEKPIDKRELGISG
jgi:hypothetical protein